MLCTMEINYNFRITISILKRSKIYKVKCLIEKARLKRNSLLLSPWKFLLTAAIIRGFNTNVVWKMWKVSSGISGSELRSKSQPSSLYDSQESVVTALHCASLECNTLVVKSLHCITLQNTLQKYCILCCTKLYCTSQTKYVSTALLCSALHVSVHYYVLLCTVLPCTKLW